MFIEINQIKKAFGAGDSRIEVLKGIQLGINQGEFCVLLGPSGSGKTTLCNLIARFWDVDSGSVKIGGRDKTK